MMPHGWLPAASTPGTCCRICSSSRAVAAWMTRRDFGAGAAVYSPAGLVVPAIRVGWTRTPPFAIVAYTSAICIAVTATPCPNDSVYLVSPYHCDSGGRSPPASFGRPTPVGRPRPHRRRYAYCVCSLLRLAAWELPRVGERAIIRA